MPQAQPLAGNPFALMMTPDAVVQAMEQSRHLDGLNRRVYRPLDRPVLPQKNARNKAAGVLDAHVDHDDHDEPEADDGAD